MIDDNDIHSAALCAWKEARGEGETGMLAVLCVLRNRVGKPGFARNLHDVIYGKNQFTSMSVASDPEYNLQPKEDDQLWVAAHSSAQQVFAGQEEVSTVLEPGQGFTDITRGALYYANLHTMQKDGWFEKHIVLDRTHHITAQIGKHTFFD